MSDIVAQPGAESVAGGPIPCGRTTGVEREVLVMARIEKDSMGEVSVPDEAYWGAQTQRAVDNFPISGLRLERRMIWALASIKQAAAAVNERLGVIDPERSPEAAKAHRVATETRLEYVLRVEGVVAKRLPGKENPNTPKFSFGA